MVYVAHKLTLVGCLAVTHLNGMAMSVVYKVLSLIVAWSEIPLAKMHLESAYAQSLLKTELPSGMTLRTGSHHFGGNYQLLGTLSC
jgi:hypothetical protein